MMKGGDKKGGGAFTFNQNVTSYNQSGGITAHTVNVNPRVVRALGDGLKKVLKDTVRRDLPVNVMGQSGNSESLAFANQIHAFLKAEGFNVDGDKANWHLFGNPPVFDVSSYLANEGREWWVVVGPAE